MDQERDKRVIIVTGASRGIGRKIALTFGKRGCRVIVNFLSNANAAETVSEEINRSGGEAVSYRADVRSADDVATMIHESVKLWGTLDVLINNAGITKDSLALRMTEQHWDEVIATNLTGAFHGIRAAAETMTSQCQGHIINISSISGMQGREGQANYSAAKAGLIGLTKSCAKELGRFNIKVNVVLPGYIPTEMGDRVSNVVHAKILQENALGRISDLQEIADFIYCLSLFKNVSGQVFNLDSRIF